MALIEPDGQYEPKSQITGTVVAKDGHTKPLGHGPTQYEVAWMEVEAEAEV